MINSLKWQKTAQEVRINAMILPHNIPNYRLRLLWYLLIRIVCFICIIVLLICLLFFFVSILLRRFICLNSRLLDEDVIGTLSLYRVLVIRIRLGLLLQAIGIGIIAIIICYTTPIELLGCYLPYNLISTAWQINSYLLLMPMCLRS